VWDARKGLVLLLSALACTACGATREPLSQSAQEAPGNEPDEGEDNPSCPARARASEPLPGVDRALESADYWIAQHEDANAPLLNSAELSRHDRALRFSADGDARVVDLTRPVTREELLTALKERFSVMRNRFASGEYVREAAALELLQESALDGFVEQRSLRVALEPMALRCAPFAGAIHSSQGSTTFDRNSCSSARAQEAVELLGTLQGHTLVRTRYALGFLPENAALSSAVPSELDAAFRQGQELELTAKLTFEGHDFPTGSLLVARDSDHAWIAGQGGFHVSPALTGQARPTARDLTRAAFLRAAFRYLGTPYGWGDEHGGRDCSRLVIDIFSSFGLHLPRHSAEQSQSGSYALDIPAQASDTERLAILDEADAQGITLVHFPGHIMIYLGRDKTGTPRALHSFAEYLAPCPQVNPAGSPTASQSARVGGAETLFEVGRVSVSDLSLGKNTSRRSFLERMTRISVFGRAPGYALLALARFRKPLPPDNLAPQTCNDSQDVALFRSPREPNAKATLRLIAVSSEEPHPAGLWLVDPHGKLVQSEVHDLGVGPFTRWLELAAPEPGKWTALLADGDHVLACERFRVADAAPAPIARAPEAAAWEARFRWERDTEHLYAAFVEQLFSHPVEDMRTWSSLSELLKDPARNLLFNHLGLAEDTRLRMNPDCADLPYFLRAYFAWKLSLPFAFRQCSRGREGVPPRCSDLRPNTTLVTASDDVGAFEAYLRQHLAPGVHSASGRTLPDDDATDIYPVPLTREALAPGSVFADPYGHVIVVAKWLPQGIAGAGMLLGADAQPDASIGRRRFFRGNFLFTPDTHDVGAGFKAFRPIVQSEKNGPMLALAGDALAHDTEHAQPSLAQYQGTAEDFYTRMDELIYPRPIAMIDRLTQVVGALEEQVRRRVDAIDVGEAYLRDHHALIDMPQGYDIFETEGAWEDFATPSRDMRLLIALDTVRDFPQRVSSTPERFGIERPKSQSGVPGGPGGQPAPAATLESEVRARLDSELESRKFSYTRSDGSQFTLTLAQVLARAETIEVGYNPNDCVERRWGAPEGSDELATCKRAAPPAQTARMAQYQRWFHERKRPPRP
jgi:cell wall-associated NlpC family hydrolase